MLLMSMAGLPAYNQLNRVVISYWLLVIDNEKHEARNPKSETISNDQNSNNQNSGF